MRTKLSYVLVMGESARYAKTMRGPARPLIPLATLICLASPLTAPHAGEVYKTVDAEGHVVYSDHADPNAPKSAVQVNVMSAKQAAGAPNSRQRKKPPTCNTGKQQAVEAAKIAKLDHDAKLQCDDAQKNFYAMKASERLYHQDSAGNRVYYSDAETAMKREEARQTMVLACTD
jgi:tRNA A37 threonylcarbamoyladenosine modification protein TsaB